jgi:hypothetical protein
MIVNFEEIGVVVNICRDVFAVGRRSGQFAHTAKGAQ